MSTLSLEFSADNSGKSFLNSQFASYPFHICRAQYFKNDPHGMANIYIQSASGGIYQNEALTTNVIANANSSSHVTTQASTIVHSMPDGHSSQTVNITVKNQAYTEYFPDPLILFPQSELSAHTRLTIDKTSTAIVIDGFITHAPHGNQNHFRKLHSSFSIYDAADKLLARDNYSVTPENLNVFKNSKFIGMGTITVATQRYYCDEFVKLLQKDLKANTRLYAGVTALPNNAGILLKFLVPESHLLRESALYYWKLIRNNIFGIEPITRRK